MKYLLIATTSVVLTFCSMVSSSALPPDHPGGTPATLTEDQWAAVRQFQKAFQEQFNEFHPTYPVEPEDITMIESCYYDGFQPNEPLEQLNHLFEYIHGYPVNIPFADPIHPCTALSAPVLNILDAIRTRIPPAHFLRMRHHYQDYVQNEPDDADEVLHCYLRPSADVDDCRQVAAALADHTPIQSRRLRKKVQIYQKIVFCVVPHSDRDHLAGVDCGQVIEWVKGVKPRASTTITTTTTPLPIATTPSHHNPFFLHDLGTFHAQHNTTVSAEAVRKLLAAVNRH